MKRLRPVDLGREHGLSAQAVRNYEQDGFLPTAERTPTGYRIYTGLHAAALRTFLALVRAYGHGTAGAVMNAVHAGRTDDALTALDHGHAQLLRDRETLASVRGAVEHLAQAAEPAPDPGPLALSIGELGHRLGLTPATLRTWEAAGILLPQRDRATGHRVFRATDVRDAELAHLLRRGGYRLPHIAAVVGQIRTAGGTSALAAALTDWQERLTARGLAMLSAAAHLDTYLTAAAHDGRA
ncbi:TioE family transcriptional regulator [Streptomyces sp. NRRL S-495]|uniref:TioE family transcriptional regulator n=1 Tax=Streptomyces sp. NRRL S-495 TaxID=1609133 RepID=UPI0005F97521|nr:TioE family transcriptional regulator [Streptomyces sp. NRRL S-495]KJY33955.1 MerR family transcriptional regulator [Streptomyces sp. NRRL S-495]